MSCCVRSLFVSWVKDIIYEITDFKRGENNQAFVVNFVELCTYIIPNVSSEDRRKKWAKMTEGYNPTQLFCHQVGSHEASCSLV